MGQVALVTGASSCLGRMIATELVRTGHTVCASMRRTNGKNADTAGDISALTAREATDLRTVELDVQSEPSIAAAVDAIIGAHHRIDVLVQNAGHMVYDPTEAFKVEQIAQQYDLNVLGTHRVDRAVLPHMRKARDGLSSVRRAAASPAALPRCWARILQRRRLWMRLPLAMPRNWRRSA